MTLDDIINSGDPREIKRALAVKMFEHGLDRSRISVILSVSESYVTKWNSIYRKKDAEGLLLGYIGSEGYLDELDHYDIIKYIKTKDTITVDELAVYITDKFGVTYSSKQSYYDLLHEAGMSRKKTEKVNPKRDETAVLAKREEIKKKLEDNADEITSERLIILLEDECHLIWKDALGYVWGKKGVPTEVPMTNERERQTYYGVINYLTHEVIVEEYDAGNGRNTVDFIKYLRLKFCDSRLLLLWDGASYHKYAETREYLKELNDGLEEKDWLVTCMLFAPNAPDQNIMEDIWLQGKCFLRKNFNKLKSFLDVRVTFQEYLEATEFNFEKLFLYGNFTQLT